MNVLEIKDIGKKYRLGSIGSGTLSNDLKRWMDLRKGKDDPFKLVGEESVVGAGTEIWALRNIDINVARGEVLGIIGKNGAGKSTLLKLLSRITEPSQGKIRARGRIASLLEVGTGMHPELTGRENVFLNGAILGMSKAEIITKFDEIVSFSGCGLYIDTPIKRYSSGMKVRLGFSVAAFLEPEILIVDEVLAVGDAEFQKKAINKMREVSNDGGRTVLFVSHNMTSIKSLCSRCILLDKGEVAFDGDVDTAVTQYLGYDHATTARLRTWEPGTGNPGNDLVQIRRAEIFTTERRASETFDLNDEIRIALEVDRLNESVKLDCTLQIYSEDGIFLASSSTVFEKPTTAAKFSSCPLTYECTIPAQFFNQGIYRFHLLIVADGRKVCLRLEDMFKVSFTVPSREEGVWMGTSKSYLLPKFQWKVDQIK